jgi:hypothetical protein
MGKDKFLQMQLIDVFFLNEGNSKYSNDFYAWVNIRAVPTSYNGETKHKSGIN